MSIPFARIVGSGEASVRLTPSLGAARPVRRHAAPYPPPMGPSTAVRSRRFTGRDDLLAMQRPRSADWTGPRRPLVAGTPGDLEWWTCQGGPDADWTSRIRIWERGGEDLGWGWFQPPSGLDWFLADGIDAAEEREIRLAILD